MVALKTFQNLNPARKKEIIRLSLQEFAFNDYNSASVNTIVQKLELGKGSFYRYFESKKDLYYYLLNYSIDQRMKHDQELMNGEISDFFELIEHHLQSKIAFDQKEPFISTFLYNVLQERNNNELKDIEQYRKSRILDMTEEMMKPFILKGQLRKDIDTRILAWAVVQNQFSFQEFVEVQCQQDFRKNITEQGKLYILPEDQLLEYGQSFIKILREGLRV